jgi:hypothetical protein
VYRVFSRCVLGLALVAGSGCDSYVDDYKARLLKYLSSEREVSINSAETYPGAVLCGEYTAIDDTGFRNVTRRYIVTVDRVQVNAGNLERSVFCSADPAAALYDALGIAASPENRETLRALSGDMHAIHVAIVNYASQFVAMPRTLQELVEGDYGLTSEHLSDPWGRPYRYEPGLSGGNTPRYELGSLGADGVSGGQGSNADVQQEHLRLVDHVLALTEAQ